MNKRYISDDYDISKNEATISQKQTTHRNAGWTRPPDDWFKLNFDGSKLDDKWAALGYVIRDSQGREAILGSKACGHTSVLVAEALALREGIKAAKFLWIKKIAIQGDNICVINSLKDA